MIENLMQPVSDKLSWRGRIWLIPTVIIFAVVATIAYRWWIRPPVVAHDNLKYIQLLWTAVSSRNEEWVNRVEQAIQERHDAGEMSNSELHHFETIIDTARTGDWETASRDSYAFAEAQLGRRRPQSISSPVPHSHSHSHEHKHKHTKENN